MKKLLLLCLIFTVSLLNAQGKLVSKTGKITFEASVPTFEEVTAINNGVTCVLNLKTNEISSLALIKGFRFKLPLMEQHFNENYIESNRYSKSTFKGKIENFDANELTSAPKEYVINGKIELRGITKKISIKANIKKINDVIEIYSKFILDASDFDINIPSTVQNKVSNTVSVTTEFALK